MELNRLNRWLLFQVEGNYQSKALNVTKDVAIEKSISFNQRSMKSDKDIIQKYVQFYLPKEILSTKYIV
jgi:hypothetical protein